MLYALMFFFQDSGGAVGFDPITMWRQMGWAARGVVIVLLIMSVISIAVMVDR